MDKKLINVNTGDYDVVDGRLVITSDELARAISDQQLQLSADEEADALEFCINLGNCGC